MTIGNVSHKVLYINPMIDKREISPDYMAQVAVVLFSQLRSEDILTSVGKHRYPPKPQEVRINTLRCDQIAKWMMMDPEFSRSYSETECCNQARCLIEYVYRSIRRMDLTLPPEREKLHVFDLLLVLLEELLIINHKVMECKFEHLLSWRRLYRAIGEELPVSIRHAQWDYQRDHSHDDRDRFDWNYVTPHDNKPLDRILQRGIADHHSHLWGSAPYFHVSWINLMNQLNNPSYIRQLQGIPPREWANLGQEQHYGEALQIRAVWIRRYLWKRLTGQYEAERDTLDRQLRNVCDPNEWYQLLSLRAELQSQIDTESFLDGFPDYLLSGFPHTFALEKQDYEILMGERWLYYQIFFDYLKPEHARRLSLDDYALFFAYFLIRASFRERMVQTNDRIGFDNFQRYERRKFDFLGTKTSKEYLMQLAVNQVIRAKHMKELELRISPDVQDLEELDKAIHLSRESREKYYYVLHFLKKAEEEAPLKNLIGSPTLKCRMDSLRRDLLDQALEIVRFRQQHKNDLAKKIRGIDAASNEIGCRPEVFARVYRLLGDYPISYKEHYTVERTLPELGKTYHVGEDFLDIVDGLRAVDEAIKFLKLDCGDRLGHATVLGIDVDDWYRTKRWRISLPIQDHLDNLAWMHHRLVHLSIPSFHETMDWIENQFEYWFRIVYRNSVFEPDVEKLMQTAWNHYHNHGQEDHGLYQVHRCHYDIESYYHSWTLRGDDPECYKNGFFQKPPSYANAHPGIAFQDHDTFPRRYEDRYIAEYSFLNYLYQFNPKVDKEGRRRICVDVPKHYILAAKAIQMEMRQYVSNCGLSIEVNPTSNVLISSFRDYREHPILAFYNRGLSVTEEERAGCAQLHVSVNTDDSGVFCTNLETEYALMVRAVEMIEDEKGHRRFCTDDIYTWIDNIRQMGLDQSFQFKRD